MRTNIKKIRKLRKYSVEFKKSIVTMFESGEYSAMQIEKLYGVRCTQVYNWIYQYSTFNEKSVRIVEMKDSNQNKVKELQNRLKELEQIVGQKQITIDYLEKMIEVAKEEYDIDIKKKLQFATIFWFKNNKEKIGYSMNQLYKNIGISKQAIAQNEVRQNCFDVQLIQLMNEVEELRRDHPGCGLEKMYFSLNPSFLGRDKFIELFTSLGFRLAKKLNYKRTTYSSPSNYPNLIKGMEVKAPSIIWQTDITYFEVGDRFYYGVFIIDVYTKIIVGYQVSDNMRATANIKALKAAIKDYTAPKIHHSDRGSQYTCNDYIELLKEHKCKISMAQSAQDNAYAERINNTIKNEYLIYWKQTTFEQLKIQVDKAVYQYNNNRIHNNLRRETPIGFYNNWMSNKRNRNTTMTIYNNDNN